MALGLTINVLLARILTPAKLGLYFLAVSFAAFMATVAPLGLDQAVVRLVGTARGSGRLAEAAETVRLCFALGLPMMAAVGVLTALAASPLVFRTLFGQPIGLAMTALVGAIVTLTAAEILVAQTWRAFEDIPRAVVFGGLASRLVFALGLAGLLLARQTVGTSTALAILLAATGLPLLVALPPLSRHMGGWRRRTAAPAPMDVIPVALPFLAIAALTALNTHLDLWIAGAVFDTAAVAIYANAAKVAMLLGTPLLVANSVLPPLIARLYAAGRNIELERVLRATATVATLPTLLGTIAVAAVGGPLLVALFGPAFEAGSTVLLLLALSQLSYVATGSCGFVLMMAGQERWVLTTGVAASATITVIGPIAAHVWGTDGVAAARGLAIVASNVALVLVAKRKTGMWSCAYAVPTRRRLEGLFGEDTP